MRAISSRRSLCRVACSDVKTTETVSGLRVVKLPISRRRVRLTDALTGYVVAELWSASNGSYRFESINANREYVVLSHDHERQFNAVVADYVKPERRP